MGVIGDILDCLRVAEATRMEFVSDKEAKEFCENNNISTRHISYGSEGNVYIDDVDNLVKRRDLNDRMSVDYDKPEVRKKRNSYSYRGLESYTDAQIRMFEICKAITKNSKGVYCVNWEKMNKK